MSFAKLSTTDKIFVEQQPKLPCITLEITPEQFASLPDKIEGVWGEINGQKLIPVKDSLNQFTGKYVAYLVLREKR